MLIQNPVHTKQFSTTTKIISNDDGSGSIDFHLEYFFSYTFCVCVCFCFLFFVLFSWLVSFHYQQINIENFFQTISHVADLVCFVFLFVLSNGTTIKSSAFYYCVSDFQSLLLLFPMKNFIYQINSKLVHLFCLFLKSHVVLTWNWIHFIIFVDSSIFTDNQ